MTANGTASRRHAYSAALASRSLPDRCPARRHSDADAANFRSDLAQTPSPKACRHPRQRPAQLPSGHDQGRRRRPRASNKLNELYRRIHALTGNAGMVGLAHDRPDGRCPGSLAQGTSRKAQEHQCLRPCAPSPQPLISSAFFSERGTRSQTGRTSPPPTFWWWMTKPSLAAPSPTRWKKPSSNAVERRGPRCSLSN